MNVIEPRLEILFQFYYAIKKAQLRRKYNCQVYFATSLDLVHYS